MYRTQLFALWTFNSIQVTFIFYSWQFCVSIWLGHSTQILGKHFLDASVKVFLMGLKFKAHKLWANQILFPDVGGPHSINWMPSWKTRLSSPEKKGIFLADCSWIPTVKSAPPWLSGLISCPAFALASLRDHSSHSFPIGVCPSPLFSVSPTSPQFPFLPLLSLLLPPLSSGYFFLSQQYKIFIADCAQLCKY